MVARTAEQHLTVPVLRMRWLRPAFLHRPYPPEAVQRLLPAGLTADEHESRAWVGLTPFTMADVRLAGRLPLPGPARFAWRACTRHAGLFWETPVDHEPWPLRAADCEEAAQDLTTTAGLPAPAGPPLAHFSDGVHQVRFGLPHPVRERGTR